MAEALQYRAHARLWAGRAENEKDPDVRQRCLALAEAYRLLADSLEKRPHLAQAWSELEE